MAIDYRWDDPRLLPEKVARRRVAYSNGQPFIVDTVQIRAPRDAEGNKMQWATPYLSEGDNPHVRAARKNKYYKG
jgi:hypothetical protein